MGAEAPSPPCWTCHCCENQSYTIRPNIVTQAHLHVSGYPCKRIPLKTFTQTIYMKTLKTYKRMWILRKQIPISGYSINVYINRFDRFRVNKL